MTSSMMELALVVVGILVAMLWLVYGRRDRESDPKRADETHPLITAAKEGDLDGLRKLLESGVPIDIQDSSGRTALHVAAAFGHKNVVQHLLHQGAEVSSRDSSGSTPLLFAAWHGHGQIARLLLDSGAQPNEGPESKDEAGRTYTDLPLEVAAVHGDLDLVKALVEKGADVNAHGGLDNASIHGGRTALMAAAGNGHLDVVESLLSKGANIEAVTSGGQTALMAAADEGHLDVVEFLLSTGAVVNAENNYGETALTLALKTPLSEVADCLIDHGATERRDNEHVPPWRAKKPNVTLIRACRAGNVPLLVQLLEDGADVNGRDENGDTPLVAVLTPPSPKEWLTKPGLAKLLTTLRILIDWGAYVNAVDANGRTPLMRVVQMMVSRASSGHREGYSWKLHRIFLGIVHALMENGASPSLADHTGMTPLDVAAGAYLPDLMQLLTQYDSSTS